ncbi:MAG: hypothetical protein K2Q10_03760 [Rhodospirillales bacterium]|nr:hypothetical protein [Rhodospirillales bacterium]
MSGLFLSSQPAKEKTVLFHPQGDGTILIETRQEVEPLLDMAKAMAAHNDGYSPTRELRRVAMIPDVVAVLWLNEGLDIHNHDDPEMGKRLARKLNDPDWLWLRTAPGRV